MYGENMKYKLNFCFNNLFDLLFSYPKGVPIEFVMQYFKVSDWNRDIIEYELTKMEEQGLISIEKGNVKLTEKGISEKIKQELKQEVVL